MHLGFIKTNCFIDDVVKKIAKHLPEYQQYIKSLKSDGYTIVGYIRKSPGSEPLAKRTKLLATMKTKLEERSLVDIVFASSCCRASDPFEKRDQKGDTISEKLDVAGNVQRKLPYLL